MITQCPKTGRTCEVTGCDGCWKVEQAEQEPVAKVIRNEAGQITMQKPDGNYFDISKHVGEYFYAAPARTKDLTDDEISRVWMLNGGGLAANCYHEFARAVIAADREKNRG